jgi:hypothetical protein
MPPMPDIASSGSFQSQSLSNQVVSVQWTLARAKPLPVPPADSDMEEAAAEEEKELKRFNRAAEEASPCLSDEYAIRIQLLERENEALRKRIEDAVLCKLCYATNLGLPLSGS